ncbi:MAG: 50S ribosomal protein L33 [Deltaproteobacteria bacterium RIFOXYA12_FULL_61_11]|nr:MAG: 50S ribosomal protein L33 [Deltaproteobacteria bacterium RIFOXYA12_FULL_61_11]
MKVIVQMTCGECKNRNYSFKKNKKGGEKLNLKKYCRHCRRHTPHKESK